MRKRFQALLLVAAMIIAGFASVQFASHASAAPALAPFTTRSYYVDLNFTSDGGCLSCYANNLGASDAQAENNELVKHGITCSKAEYIAYTILDFGSPRSTYTGTWTGHSVSWGNSLDEVANIAENYASSWYIYSYNCFILDLIIGVSNSYICGNEYASSPCDGQVGNALANDVNTLNNSMAKAGDAWQILGKGGLDAEAYYEPNGPDSFGSYAATNGLVTGYNNYLFTNGKSWNLYDFGAAGSDCWTTGSDPINDWCEGPGLAAHVYDVAWGDGYDEAFPEAYTSGLNSEWQAVDSYSSSSGSQGPIQYSVVMLSGNQSNATNCSEWNDFVSKNAGYIPNSPFYASFQPGVNATYKAFFYC